LAKQGRTKCEAELIYGHYEAHNTCEVLLRKLLLNKETREGGQITGTKAEQCAQRAASA